MLIRRLLLLSSLFAASPFTLAAAPAAAKPAAPAKAARPNILFILADDQNWAGLSVPMDPAIPESKSRVIETPALAKLAEEGMRFSQAYAPAPVCSPTRISLLTGKTPAQNHWTKAAPSVGDAPCYKLLEPSLIKSLSTKETTHAELLKAAGYGTAHYGKWHVSGGGPAKHGFDEGDGDTGNRDADDLKAPDPDAVFSTADRAADFMRRMKKEGRPFFIQISSYALHVAQNALPETIAKYRAKLPDGNDKEVNGAAIAENLDSSLARLFRSLDEAGLRDNTYVIYMADNGASGKRGVLRGGKGSLDEAGIRVPFIIRGPGIAAGSVCRTAIGGVDLYPTFAAIAGIPASALPAGLAGGDLSPLLHGKATAVKRAAGDGLTFHFPHYQGSTPSSALITGDWKLVHYYEDGRDELYNLTKDIGEKHNLAATEKERAAALRAELMKRLKSESADMPQANPAYDPSAPREDAKSGGKGAKEGRKAGGKKGGKGKSADTES